MTEHAQPAEHKDQAAAAARSSRSTCLAFPLLNCVTLALQVIQVINIIRRPATSMTEI